MEPIFTIPYPEYVVAEKFAEIFKKNDGYSIYVPASRQQKGVDLLLAKQGSTHTKALTIQVKSSKVWLAKKPSKKDIENGIDPLFTLWFKQFRYENEFSADVYIFIGLKPIDLAETKKKKASAWEPVMLMFTHEQLKEYFERLVDWSLYFTFDKSGKVFFTRGLETAEDITKHLFNGGSVLEITDLITLER